MMELHICHLYPDVLNLYGDRGNVLCMQKRLTWRGIGCTVTELLVEEYVSPLLKQNIDTLILGCTHYPLLTGIFSKLCGPDVALINPGYEAVSALRELLSENDALRGGGPACGEHYYVSDSEQQFLQYAEMFLRGPVHGQVQRIDIENY